MPSPHVFPGCTVRPGPTIGRYMFGTICERPYYQVTENSVAGQGAVRGTWSIVYPGQSVAVKYYTVGIDDNLEPSILSFLSGRVDCVPSLLGEIRAIHPLTGQSMSLGVAMERVRGSLVGDIVIEALKSGRDVTGLLHKLGACLGRVHQALRHYGEGWRRIRAAWPDRLKWRARLLRSWAAEDRLVEKASGALQWFHNYFKSRSGELEECLAGRIHGDFHLYQAFLSGKRVVIFDFEGEPLKWPFWRDEPEPPLRDVAGLVRSVEYAMILSRATRNPGEIWESGAAVELVSSFVRGLGGLPWEGCPRWGLLFWLVERASYEAVYEMAVRTGLERIPLEALVYHWRNPGRGWWGLDSVL